MVIRVGIISDAVHEQRTGIGNYVWQLLKGLEERQYKDINVKQLLPSRNAQAPGTQLVAESPFFSRSIYSWYPYAAYTARTEDMDILHNPAQVPTYFRPRPGYVITVHDLVPLIFPRQSKLGRPTVYRLLFKRTVCNAGHIITVSKSTRKDLIERLGVSARKISVIPLAAGEQFQPNSDPGLDNAIRHRIGLDRPYILYVGTMEIRKNIPALIHAFNRLCSQGLPHLLVLTGKLGWKTRGVEKALDASPFKHRIILTGFVADDDLPALYRGADVFVYPSLYEGFGLPPLEAMACGTPVIASNSSSLPEVVGNAGILIPPEDSERLGTELYRLVYNPAISRRIGRSCLQRAQKFSWPRCVDSTIEVYRELVMSSGAVSP